MVRKWTAVIASGVLVALAGVSVASAGDGAQKATGTFAQVPGHPNFNVTGTAELVRLPSGQTYVKVKVEGLDPGETYPSHVHNAPCSTGGGGHYMNDPAGPAAPPNELWPSTDSTSPGITANPKGKGVGTDQADWLARPEAQSVVIHLYSNTAVRVACAQLTS